MRVVRHWQSLLRAVVDALSLDVFKASLDGTLSSPWSSERLPAMVSGFELDGLDSPFQQKPFYESMTESASWTKGIQREKTIL